MRSVGPCDRKTTRIGETVDTEVGKGVVEVEAQGGRRVSRSGL